MTVLVGWIMAVGMVVVVPLGLRLLDDDRQRLGPVSQVWPFAGLLGGLSLLLDRGEWFAVALASLYAAVTVWLAVLALLRLVRRRSLVPAEIGVLTAMVTPAVAGNSLVAERGGWELLGFGMTTLTLTVAHFHFAGFAAALIAGLAASRAPSAASRIAALTVPAGTALVFAGYFTGDEVELAGAVVLTAGMWLLGWTVLSDVAPHLSLTWMAATHGLANALGFALCGVLAWRRLQRA